MTIPTTEPLAFAGGETLKWRKFLTDYPATAGWTLKYYFRGPGAGFDEVATADGDDYLVVVASATTAPLVGGDWFWQGWIEKGAEKYLVASGQAKVTAALPASGSTYDGRSSIKKILDAIDAMIQGKATQDQQEYQIGDRMLRRYPIGELVELRKTYANLYTQEQQTAGQAKGRPLFKTVLTKFTTPE